jgi:hypothetical protein
MPDPMVKDHLPSRRGLRVRAIGKPGLPYVQFKNEDFKHGLVGAGLSESAADSYIEMYESMNRGTIQGTVKRTPSNTTPTTL